jgi:transposase
LISVIKWSQFCLLDAAGQIQQEGRVRSTRSAFQARFGALAPARMALETGTHSLWASELLTELGHEVIPSAVVTAQAGPLGARGPGDPVMSKNSNTVYLVSP